MKKPAITKYDIHPVLKERWSPRIFDSKPVEEEKLKRIFEAARWAPSAFNEQPWRFIIGKKGSKSWDDIYETLIGFNQAWTKTADVLALVVGKTHSSNNGKPNATFEYDTGQSVAHLTFQTTSEGLFIHQMSGFSKEKAKEIFEIPDGFEPLTAFAIGYMGNVEDLNEDFQKMEKSPRERKQFDEFVFEGKFGNSINKW